jgi:hypothetical protein
MNGPEAKPIGGCGEATRHVQGTPTGAGEKKLLGN